MSELHEAPRDDGEPPSRGPRRALLGGACCLALLFGCVGLAFAPRLLHRLRQELAQLDTQVRLGPERPDGFTAGAIDATIAAKIVDGRLERAGIVARVGPDPAGTGLEIACTAGDRARVLELACPKGDLRILPVVELEGPDLEVEVARLRARPDDADRRLLEHEGALLVVEYPGIGGEAFDRVYRTDDNDGRPAIGATLTARGAERMLELTSRSIGKRLALVIDDQAISVPEVRSAIGRKLIVSAGDRGWSEDDILRLTSILGPGALPCRLVELPP